MARIRTIKPEFYRHEGLQDLEIKNPGAYPMLVFQGLWSQCDRNGVFQWRPRQLKLDILPFLPFDMATTLLILEKSNYLVHYYVDGKEYGQVPTFSLHQRITGKEATAEGGQYPLPCVQESSGETVGKQWGNTQETPGKNKLLQGAQEGKEEGKGKEEEEMNTCSEPEKASGLEPSDSQTDISRLCFFDCAQKKQPNTLPGLDVQLAAVISIPLVCKKNIPLVEFTVTQVMVDDWAESYPAVDTMQTLREIRQWNLANPTRRKTASGILNHITSWLAKAQNKGGSTRQMSPTTKPEFRVIPGMPARTVNNINAASAFLDRQQHEKAG
jgi:hypothetical protein